MTVIDFEYYRRRKEEKDKGIKAIEEIRKRSGRSYTPKGEYPEVLENRIMQLEQKDLFNLNFLILLDCFIQEDCPEFYWRFDIFLDELSSGKES